MYRHRWNPISLAFIATVGLSACGEAPVNQPPVAPETAVASGTMPGADNRAEQPSSVADANAGPLVATASSRPDAGAAPEVAGGATVADTNTGGQPATPAALPLLVVTRTATCGCCHLWVEHMQQAGFKVEVHDVEDMGPAKARVGIPYGKGSCHTAEVGGYFVEGHVPAEDVKRLLVEKPDAKGLTLPGMPLGSPGMEVPDGRVQPYVVELVAKDGSTSPFARHGH